MDKQSVFQVTDNLRNIPDDSGINYCERVLGGSGNLNAMSTLWISYSHLFRLVTANELIEFVSDANIKFTSEEADAFRTGLSAIPLFLARCALEVQNRKELDDLGSKAQNEIE